MKKKSTKTKVAGGLLAGVGIAAALGIVALTWMIAFGILPDAENADAALAAFMLTSVCAVVAVFVGSFVAGWFQ